MEIKIINQVKFLIDNYDQKISMIKIDKDNFELDYEDR